MLTTAPSSPTTHEQFMRMAIAEANNGMHNNHGGPFGAIIVKEQKVIARAHNRVLIDKDPTAHAEINAIRLACAVLNDFMLTGCIIYSSCEPCPMCLSALYWARINTIYYGNTRHDAASIGFDDEKIYQQFTAGDSMDKKKQLACTQCLAKESWDSFSQWSSKHDRVNY